MKMSFRWSILAGSVFLHVSCGTLSSRVLYDSTESVQRLNEGGSIQAEADQLARPLIESGKISGMVVGVVTPDGAAQSFSYGFSEHSGAKKPLSENDIFQVGSVSKLFIASVVAILVDEGKLHYEDTVREILPPEIPVSEDAGELTLYELITHTGGLPRESMGLAQLKDFIRYLFTGKNLYSYLDRDYLYEYLRSCKIKPKGKRGYQYSNIGLALLTHLIEVKTGKSFPELAEEKIFEPLKMNNTTFSLNEVQRRSLAVGHAGKDEPRFMRRHQDIAPWDMGDTMRSVGGLYSTPHDLLIFCKANLGMIDYPSKGSLVKMHRAHVETPAEDVALGWLVNYFDDRRITLHYKHGMVSGYSAYVGLNIKQQIAVVVLTTNFEWDDEVGHNLLLRLSRAQKGDSSSIL